VRKILTIILLVICAASAGVLWLVHSARPPSEAFLLQRFQTHRGDFEELCEMLRQDGNISKVRSFGITTTNADSHDITPQQPEESGFPRERYEQYLATLKAAGADIAARDRSGFYFRIARWGWAGSGWEIQVGWDATVPTNQVPSLDDYWKSPVPKEDVYRHIEGNWYLWMHWHK
jgi:hypothetical protein